MILENINAKFDPEESWNDIFLKIVDRNEDKDSIFYTAKGMYEGKVVGLKVEVKKGMVAGFLPSGEVNQDAFYRDGIRFYSVGNESNELLKALSSLYRFPTDKPFSKSVTGALSFSLNEIPLDFNSKYYFKFKLFFHDDSEDLYCELFCNIDLKNDIIELHEKDAGYRENIIKTFSN